MNAHLATALRVVVLLGGTLQQIKAVRLRTRIRAEEHARQRLLAEYVEIADPFARLGHVPLGTAVQEHLIRDISSS